MSGSDHRERRIEGRNGTSLFAQSWHPDGEPRDVVVIAHGYAEHSSRYGNVVDALLPLGYAIYAIDHRGHGRSEGRRAVIERMDWVIEDLRLLIEQARRESGRRRVKLLGHSMGGSVAFGYALRFPDDLSGLVLSGPAIGGQVPLIQRLLLRLLSRFAPNLGTIALPPEAICNDPAVVAAYQADPLVTVGKVPARTAGEMIAAAGRYATRAAEMRVPVLIQHGVEDKLILLDGNRAIYADIGSPDKTVITYPGLRHEIYNEADREQVMADLTGWLTAHPAQ